MRVLASLPQHDLRAVSHAAQAFEAAHYDGLVTMENRHDPFMPLAIAATVTQRIELATSVAIAFPRSPMVTANIGWDLQRASLGRFNLGIGSQIRPHNEKRFSTPWSAPAPRIREYVLAMRAIWDCWSGAGPLSFRGQHYTFTLMTPAFTPPPLDTAAPRVSLAAVGPAMLRVAGEVCDGVRLHPFCTRRYIENVVMPELETGFQRGQRRRQDIEIVGGGFIATGATDQEVDKACEWVRTRIGFYGSTPAYWPVLEQHDLGDLGRKLNALSKQGRWQQMSREVPDEVVHLMAAVARHDELAATIERRFGALSDSVSITQYDEQIAPLPPEVIQDIQRI